MSQILQPYEKVNDYDFLPASNEGSTFKDPREFTNVLFKRMSYHYEDNKGKISDFIIAKGFAKQDASINQNLNLKYHSNRINLRQSIDRKDDELQDKVRRKSTIEAEESWLHKQQNAMDSMAQYSFTLKNDYKSSLDKLDELKGKQGYSDKVYTSSSNTQQNKHLILNHTLDSKQKNTHQLEKRSSLANPTTTKNLSVVIVSNSQKDNRSKYQEGNLQKRQSPSIVNFQRQTETSFQKMKDTSNKQMDNCSLQMSILSRPNSALHTCSKLSRMYPINTNTTNTNNNTNANPQTINNNNNNNTIEKERRSQSQNVSQISQRREYQSIFNGQVQTTDNYNFTSSANNKNSKQSNKGRTNQQNTTQVNAYSKDRFHRFCKKLENITSINQYLKMSEEELEKIAAQSDEDEQTQQQKTNTKRVKSINQSNIQIVKQQQHDQLLKIVDVFQDAKTTFRKTFLKDKTNKSSMNSTFMSLSQNYNISSPMTITKSRAKKQMTQPNSENTAYSPFYQNRDNLRLNQFSTIPFNGIVTINSPITRKDNKSPSISSSELQNQNEQLFNFSGPHLNGNQGDQNNFTEYIENIEGADIVLNAGGTVNTRLKALHLKQYYSRMKNVSGRNADGEETYKSHITFERNKINLGLQQKIKLFNYIEDDDEINLNYSKPKKFVRRQAVTSQKQKKEKSFVEEVRDQQNQIGIKNLKQKYGKYVAKLYEFLQKCIPLQVCVDDIIEFKVFTSKPFERPGSYVFFKMIKQNQFEYVKNSIQECRWRIFDYDHMMMTALHIAIIKGYKDMAIFLIDKIPDLEAEDVDNKTPLWYAITTRQYDIAKYLLINRASPWANDNFKYYDIIDDIDMRSSLKLARQLFFLMKCSSYKNRQKIWEDSKNKILDPLAYYKI